MHNSFTVILFWIRVRKLHTVLEWLFYTKRPLCFLSISKKPLYFRFPLKTPLINQTVCTKSNWPFDFYFLTILPLEKHTRELSLLSEADPCYQDLGRPPWVKKGNGRRIESGPSPCPMYEQAYAPYVKTFTSVFLYILKSVGENQPRK